MAYQIEMFPRKPFDLRELPAAYQPQMRAETEGVSSLTELELMTLLVGPTKTESALDVAGRILSLGDELNRATIQELTAITGSRRKALRLAAALELGRRINAKASEDRQHVQTPEDASAILMPRLRHLEQEHFLVLMLNTKNCVLGVKTVAVGSLNSTGVQPREVFKNAIRRSAAAVILAHNHPSGDPAPTRKDVALTQRLIQAGELLGIEVLDHIIIGDGKYVSLKAEKLI
jgi:DNA repair protein RadC